jgi:hydrogenase/urease accessory protein HupE
MPASRLKTIKTIAACALWTGANSVFAHDGHGLSGPHGHATDAWGLMALGAMVALGIWLSRGGK